MVATAAIGACSVSKTPEDAQAETAGPQLAILCLDQGEWPRLLDRMREFGVGHELELHGGIEADAPDGRPLLNAYLAQGYSYYFGDDFDLWFVSDPFRPGVLYLSGIPKRKPMSPEQTTLANSLILEVSDFTTIASGPKADPHC